MTDANARIAELEQLLKERDRELEHKENELAEANRLKAEFLARMSHDLRTPMNAIIGYTRILMRKLEETIDPRQYQNLENIETSAHHLLNLINDILDLSKVEAGRIDIFVEEVDLRRLATECLAGVAPKVGEGVELAQELDGVETIHTDVDRLRRAIANLSNAAKSTEAGRIVLFMQRQGEELTVAVSDTGVGIPAADLPHIFDEFRPVARKGRNAEQGTGLGLAIVKRSVELLGGRVEAESEEGKGTTFTLRLQDKEAREENT
tara:strand:+ start:358 stop:1149 length:792 start_codon:yes stop_codon:yes gene_type:complete